MGSGSLAAMAVFESKYKEDLDEKSAVALVDEAIQAGIFNDLGSGGNVDICILSKSKGQTMLRNYQKPTMGRYTVPTSRPFPKGTTGMCDAVLLAAHASRRSLACRRCSGDL
jgi:20S proteasome subunit beta 2